MKLRKSLVKPVIWQKTCNDIELFGFRPRSSCMTHITADVQRITLNASMHDDAFNAVM